MNSVSKARRVLVVDDEKVIADSLAAILCACGYTARAVYSAIGAVAAAKDLTPHTLISDVLMPEVNGVELAAYFAEHYPECTVMLMSGNPSAPVLLDAAVRQGQPHSTSQKRADPAQILEALAALAPQA